MKSPMELSIQSPMESSIQLITHANMWLSTQLMKLPIKCVFMHDYYCKPSEHNIMHALYRQMVADSQTTCAYLCIMCQRLGNGQFSLFNPQYFISSARKEGEPGMRKHLFQHWLVHRWRLGSICHLNHERGNLVTTRLKTSFILICS